MRKLFLIVLALLFSFGVANAAGIPLGIDPKNTSEIWTQSVYNGTSSTIQSGLIVIWDYDTSDVTDPWYDDVCPWVKLPTEDDDIWTAGVVPYGKPIAAGSEGVIIIKGPAWIKTGASGTINQMIGATASTGVTVDFGAGTDDCAIGRVIKADATTNIIGSGYTLVDVCLSCND